MSRDLEVISAGWEVGVGQPLTVMLNVVSRDLKYQPVHHLPLSRKAALKLAWQLIAAVERVEELNAEAQAKRAVS